MAVSPLVPRCAASRGFLLNLRIRCQTAEAGGILYFTLYRRTAENAMRQGLLCRENRKRAGGKMPSLRRTCVVIRLTCLRLENLRACAPGDPAVIVGHRAAVKADGGWTFVLAALRSIAAARKATFLCLFAFARVSPFFKTIWALSTLFIARQVVCRAASARAGNSLSAARW